MALTDYEEILFCKITNMTGVGWRAPLLSADFGDGRESGAFSAPARGLHSWTLSANMIPDTTDSLIEYTLPGIGKQEGVPYFTYLEGFIKRHVMANNKPFIVKNPRTNKKYLVCFDIPGYDFEQATAKIFAGGVKIRQRTVSDVPFNADGSLFVPELSSTPLSVTLARNSATQFIQNEIGSPVWTLDGLGTLTQTGLYTAPNSAATVKVRVHSSFWNYVNSAYFTKNSDDTLTKNTATPGYFMQAKSNGYINNVGDSVEFTIPNNNTYWIGIENDATTRRFVYFSGNVREYHPSNGGGYVETDITNLIAGDVVKIEMIAGGYLKMSVNGTAVVASTAQTFSSQNMRFILSADMANAVIVKCPKMVATGYTEFYADITVT